MNDLDEMIRPLNAAQQNYVLMVLLGCDSGTAMKLSDRDETTITSWRTKDSYFKEIESYIADNSRFSGEAARLLFKRTKSKGLIALHHIIASGYGKFDQLSPGDQRRIMQALALLPKFEKRSDDTSNRASNNELEEETYEDRLKRWRKNK